MRGAAVRQPRVRRARRVIGQEAGETTATDLAGRPRDEQAHGTHFAGTTSTTEQIAATIDTGLTVTDADNATLASGWATALPF